MLLDTLKSAFSGGSSNVQTISASSAVQLFGEKDTVFLDVRGPGEIAASGTVKGAVRIPLPELSARLSKGGAPLPPASAGKLIVCVCASGNRSSVAASQLAAAGYGRVANLSGGFGGWARAGGKTER